MNFEAQAVSGTVKESLHAPVSLSRFKAPVGEERFNGPVDVASVDTGPNALQRELLALFDRPVQVALPAAGLSLQNGPGNVAEVAGLFGAREDVEDDRLASQEGAAPLLVWIAAIFATGHDGMLAGAVVRKQALVYEAPHSL